MTGTFTKSLVSDTPADLNSDIYKHYENTLKTFEGEAVYIYSFKEERMLYAKGWKDVLGYNDDEISLLKIISSSSKRHADFSLELNDNALRFLQRVNKDLEKYSFTLEVEKITKEGKLVPLFSRISVYKAVGNNIELIIGTSQIIPTLKFGEVMQYAAYGPEKSNFEETLNRQLFSCHAISRKEKEALKYAAEGYALKEIAHKLNVSQSAIEKRIIPLYKRFNVNGLPHLISFAYKNHIL